MKVFFWILLALIMGANVYVGFGLWRLLPGPSWLKAVVIGCCILLFATLFCNFWLGERLPVSVTAWLHRISTSWLFVFAYIVLLLLVVEVLRLIPTVKPWVSGHWLGSSLFVGLLTVVFVGGYIHYQHKVRVPLKLTLARPLKHPLRVVVMSDLHAGYFIGKNEIRRWIKQINAEKPDMVLIAGDIIDNSVRPLQQAHFEEVLNELKAPLGVYACMGNHEYISQPKAAAAFLEKTPIRLLKDEAVLVDNQFYVLGRDDRMNARRHPLAELVKGLDPHFPVILLDHQPYHLEEAERSGIDLQLSGHTHRGQIWPFSWIVDRMYEVSHGYLRKGKTHIYVSSGIGIWGGKFRIGTQSEYIVIDLS